MPLYATKLRPALLGFAHGLSLRAATAGFVQQSPHRANFEFMRNFDGSREPETPCCLIFGGVFIVFLDAMLFENFFKNQWLSNIKSAKTG